MNRVNAAFLGKGLGAYLGLSGLMVFAVVLRDAVLLPALGPVPAQWLGAGVAIAFLFGFTALVLRMLQEPRSRTDLWALGGLWAALTALLHAFLVLRLLGAPAAEWARAYNLFAGQAWPLILLALLLAPPLAGRDRPPSPA